MEVVPPTMQSDSAHSAEWESNLMLAFVVILCYNISDILEKWEAVYGKCAYTICRAVTGFA